MKIGDRVQSITTGFTHGMIGTVEDFTYAHGERFAFIAFDALGQQIALPTRLLRPVPHTLH